VRVGLDVYTVTHLGLDAFQTLDYCTAHGLEGAHFFTPFQLSETLDMGRMREIRQEADRRGLYFEVGLPTVNPHKFGPEHDARVRACARACRELGCRELRSHFGARGDRLNPTTAWADQIRDGTDYLRTLGPLLRDLDCRIDLETHADCTTTELLRVVEALGEDRQGICIDVGNTFRQLEDPVAAVRRAAPYTHITHTKDAILFFTDRGLAWQTRPCGEGAIDWSLVLPILGEHAPALTLSIEDEPYVRDLPIFEPDFLAYHPDLTPLELAALVRVAHAWTPRIERGEVPEPYAYEAEGWRSSADGRIDRAAVHLKTTLDALGLRG